MLPQTNVSLIGRKLSLKLKLMISITKHMCSFLLGNNFGFFNNNFLTSFFLNKHFHSLNVSLPICINLFVTNSTRDTIWASFDPIFIMMSEQGIRNGPEHNFKMLVSKMNG